MLFSFVLAADACSCSLLGFQQKDGSLRWVQFFSLSLGRRWTGERSWALRVWGLPQENLYSTAKELSGGWLWEKGRWLAHFPGSFFFHSFLVPSWWLNPSIPFISFRLSFLVSILSTAFYFLYPRLLSFSPLSYFIATADMKSRSDNLVNEVLALSDGP